MMVSIIAQQVMNVYKFLYMGWRRNYSQITNKAHVLWNTIPLRTENVGNSDYGLDDQGLVVWVLAGTKQLFTKVSSCFDVHSIYSWVLVNRTLRVKPQMQQGIKLTTHLHLQPRSSMHVIIPPLSRQASENGT